MLRKLFATLLALAMVIALFAGCGNQTAAENTDPAAEETAAEKAQPAESTVAEDASEAESDDAGMYYDLGDHVDDFTVELSDGTVFNLNEALETHDVVMINIWATWCGPCQMEFPVMDAAYADYMDKVALVALSPFDDNEAVAEFKEELGLVNIPMGSDTVGAGGFVMEGYPTTVIIDRFGNYVYYECGSILDEGGFTRMWDCFLGDDYTESKVLYEIPGPDYEGEYPDDETLSRVLSPNGSVSFYSNPEDTQVWPFLPAETGVYASCSNVNSASAAVYADITAEAGQVFSFDYTVDTDAGSDLLVLYINDEPVTVRCGCTSGTCVYRFEEAGDYTVTLSFEKDEYPAEDETITDCVEIANAALLSGDAADAAIAAMPDYPQTLSGTDYAIDLLNEGAKEIVLNDPTGFCDEYYEGIRMFIVPEDTATVRIRLGEELDPYLALAYGDTDYVYHILSLTDTDDEGFVFETTVSSVEDGGYDNTYLYLVTNMLTGEYDMFFIFKNEENVNYFIHQDVTDDYGNAIEGLTWEYADGTQPSTDADAQEPASTYNVYLQDENGSPVDGVMINVCDADTCQPMETSGGYYGFDGDPYAYVIHVLKVPESYAFDTTQEFVFDEEGGSIIITIPHA